MMEPTSHHQVKKKMKRQSSSPPNLTSRYCKRCAGAMYICFWLGIKYQIFNVWYRDITDFQFRLLLFIHPNVRIES